ncbi:MAG TPA: asparagine synthase (glutamine-hydrolyzing) [Rhodanobacteraceae bacterium]|nr:asparagine synthase (glutamine-hydrolyzing) [Rhodanobacteraceae bacterium]
MCGICGILNLDGSGRSAAGDESRVATMLHAMRHRGPDGEARLVRGNLVMAANRLAIRGTNLPQPPLLECDGGIVLACNGEIDNHHELRRSLGANGWKLPTTDVAVIAPLYVEDGLEFVQKLHGPFALALWDPDRQRLILGRDRAGERHLYYAVTGHSVIFASELAALATAVAARVEPNVEALAHYLRSGYCPAPLGPLTGIRKVAPGAVVVIDAAGTTSYRYWSLPASRLAVQPSRRPFDSIMRDAIVRQSDVDVDYGVLLSGGVDSALVTALLRKLHPNRQLPAYGIRFAEASFDEGDVARRVARELGCEFVPVTVTAGDFPRTLRTLIAATGELIADPAWIPIARVAERASRDVRLLFGGEGADELFGGYPTYLGARWLPCYTRLPAGFRALLRRMVEAWPVTDKKVAVSFLLKQFVRVQPGGGLASHVAWTSSIDAEWLRRLGIKSSSKPGRDGSAALLDTVQHYDFTHLLPEAYLAKSDRGAMLHGVEIRSPFLDRNVVEFAASLPVSARVRGLKTKAFLKSYASEYLPGAVVNRRKRGLSVPLSMWFRGPLREWARSRLESTDLAAIGIDAYAALALLDEHERRCEDHARAIWTLVVLSEWLEWLRGTDAAPVASGAHARDIPQRGLAGAGIDVASPFVAADVSMK